MPDPSKNDRRSYLQIVCRYLLLLCLVNGVVGNVEKTIFLAPVPWTVPAENTAIDDLGLDRLSPTDYMLRTNLNASFPSDDEPYGSQSWFYIEDLTPGQRYEIRICWMATQPTAFSLQTYTLQEVVSSETLLPSLLNFSDARVAGTVPPSSSSRRPSGDRENHPARDNPSLSPGSDHHLHAAAAGLGPTKALHQHNSRLRRSRSSVERERGHDPLSLISHTESVLFLRIWAAADYYTTNTTLMASVPPVMADLILDPFIWNVFPRSLVPTAVYTVIIAVVAYFVGGVLARSLSDILTNAGEKDETVDGVVIKKER